MGAPIIIKILLIALLTLFLPLTAFSFYRFQLRKKEEEYTTIIKALKFDDSEAAASLLGLRNEYSAIDYALPVAFAAVLCALGTTALFLGSELKIAEAPSILLSGIYLGAKGTGYASYQQQSLLALTMGFIGGYTWSVQYIFRRFVTIDLPPRAYYSIGIRMILAALVALMIGHFLEATPGSEYTSGMIPVVAFLTGMFPERALHYLNRNFHFELHLHPKTYASYPVVSIANRPGLFEVVVRHISAVLRSRCAGFACPACLAADTCPARPLLST